MLKNLLLVLFSSVSSNSHTAKSFTVATFSVTSFIWIKALCRNAALPFLFLFYFKATFQKFT